jgi:transcriptional regulator with XRE-family HTH domain
MTQRQAAERAGITQSHWSKIERGEIEPSIAQMLRVHFALEGESLESYFGDHPSIRALS